MTITGDSEGMTGSRTTAQPGARDSVQQPAARGAVAIDRLVRQFRRLMEHLCHAEELAEAIAFEIAALKRAVAADASGRLAATAREALAQASTMRRRQRGDDALRLAAAEGIRTLDLRMRAGGGAVVRVGDGKWFTLTPVLATILWALAYGAPPGADGFPSWQKVDHVIGQIGKKQTRPPSRRAITQAVFRLRRVMAVNGANPYLVQVDRQHGLRFLLKNAGA